VCGWSMATSKPSVCSNTFSLNTRSCACSRYFCKTAHSFSRIFWAFEISHEDDVGNVAGQQPQPWLWTLPPQPRRHVVHTFTEATNGKSGEVAHVTSESTPLSILLLFFAEVITLLVVETNRYYHQFLENSDDQHSPECEVTEAEMFAFLALTLQKGHGVQGRLEDYWTKMEQLHTSFYGQTMAHARYCHILRFLHLTDNNRNGVDRTDDRLWRIRDLFEIIRTNFPNFTTLLNIWQ